MADHETLKQLGLAKQEPKLMNETQWSRTYQVGQKDFYRESKFLSDGLQIPADDIIQRWATLTLSERHDFASAFRAKPTLTANDETILTFLMQVGDEIVWRTICVMLCRHSNREIVKEFVITRLKTSSGNRANYYQAAENIRDTDLVSILECQFHDYQRNLASDAEPSWANDRLLREFLQLCKTLATITGDIRYEEIIRSHLGHPSNAVNGKARLLLSNEAQEQLE
jgi:hypothetical protein